MTYTVVITEYAIRQLKKLPPQVVAKLKEAIAALANDPRPHNHIKLTNVEAYRIRVNNYRVVYEINDNVLTVTVVEVSDRKETYKKSEADSELFDFIAREGFESGATPAEFSARPLKRVMQRRIFNALLDWMGTDKPTLPFTTWTRPCKLRSKIVSMLTDVE